MFESLSCGFIDCFNNLLCKQVPNVDDQMQSTATKHDVTLENKCRQTMKKCRHQILGGDSISKNAVRHTTAPKR